MKGNYVSHKIQKDASTESQTAVLRFGAAALLVFLSFLSCHPGEMQIPEAASPSARLYRQNCTLCHALPHPHRHSPAQWEHVMRLMQRHRKNRGMPEINPKDYQAILGYLQSHARK